MRGILGPPKVFGTTGQPIVLHRKRTQVRALFTARIVPIVVTLMNCRHIRSAIHHRHILREGIPDSPPIPIADPDHKRRNVVVEALGKHENVHVPRILLNTLSERSTPSLFAPTRIAEIDRRGYWRVPSLTD
jgi:hypothetical protein